MNTNVGKQRKGGRLVSGPGRRNRTFDKSIMNEGIYTNPRIVHATLLLVGCSVQVQVKNGGIYEGIFKTMSQDVSSQVVLEMAHKVDPSKPDTVPTKEMLIKSLIFGLADVVQVTAVDVDLDYAHKDNFTDVAISKINNGGSVERELQPWDGEGQSGALETLEKGSSSSANGWDPEEMFNTNANKFDIKSSYDPALSQYTTPLVKKDTKEYRDREAHAMRLAQEIEKSEDYCRRIAVENGDGDDEELKFSAVIRPGETNNNTAGGKYVPPHLRKVPAQGHQMHPTPPQSMPSGSQSPHAQSPSPHQQPSSLQQPPSQLQQPSPHQQSSPVRNMPGPGLSQPHQTATRSPNQPTPVQVSVSTAVMATNEDQDNKSQDERKLSEQQERGKSSERTSAGQPVPPGSLVDPKKINHKGRVKIQELKEFGNAFKLKDNESKDAMERKLGQPSPVPPSSSSSSSQPAMGAPQQQPTPSHNSHPQQPEHVQQQQPPQQLHHQQQQQQQMSSQAGYSQQGGHMQPSSSLAQHGPIVPENNKPITTAVASAASAVPTDKKDEEKLDDDLDKKSSMLNPLAEVFVPACSKPTFRQPPIPGQTPPRAATQSPVIVQSQGPMNPYIQYVLPPGSQPVMPSAQAPRINPAKRATVSAQAAAATGQPLLQTPIPSQNPQYPVQPFNIQVAPNAQGAAMQQVFQQGIVPMAGNMRVVAPHMVQGATTPTDQISFPQGQHPMFVSQLGHPNMSTMPSYIGGPQSAGGAGAGSQQVAPTHTMPTHMAPHHHATPPHSQTNHMSSQVGSSGAHPNPSPVPQHATANHLPPQQQGHHPANSGTPQPQHLIYQHSNQGNPQQAGPGHPPLQPSPHTPTSPPTIYPTMPYSQSYPMQPHQYNTSTGQQPAILTVTQSHHHQHSGIAMMPTPQHQHNPHQANHQIQHNAVTAGVAGPPQQAGQYQLNHAAQLQQGHHIQGAPTLTGQAGPGLPMGYVQQQHMIPQNPQHYHHNQ